MSISRLNVGYLILSFFSSFIELGTIILMIKGGYPLIYIPMIGLAYQMGAIFREPISLNYGQYIFVLFFSGILSIFSSQSFTILFIAVFLLSIGIQGIRGMLSEHQKTTTFTKRVFRVGGFASSGLLSYSMIPIVSFICLIISFLLLKNKHPQATIKNNFHPYTLGWIMMLHQTHYFSYAYVIPILIINFYGINQYLGGVFFCVGWLSYISARKLLGEKKVIINFCLGHIWVALTLNLIFLFYNKSLLLLLILWFLTGFGGGTVYCLRVIRKKSESDKSDLDIWENIGHVVGIILCIIMLIIFDSPVVVFIFSSIIATLTCLLFFYTQWKMERNKIME